MTGRRIGRLIAGLVVACCAAATAAQDKGPQAGTAAAPAPVRAIDTLQRIRDTGVMPIGVRDASFPFSFFDESKHPQGYSIDLCLRLADAIKTELGLPRLEVRYILVSTANRVTALQEGRIDLECGSTGNTRERQKDVAFAYTTFVAGIRLLIRRSSPITGIDDLFGKTIVVTRGTTGEQLMGRLNAERLLKLVPAAQQSIRPSRAAD